METLVKTLRVRVRNKHAALLKQMAYEVNQVFNFVNEKTFKESYEPIPFSGHHFIGLPNRFTVSAWTNGLVKEKGYHITSATVQEIVAHHNKACKQFKKAKLRWRKSSGSNRSLGFVPFRVNQCKWKNGQVQFGKHHIRVIDSYGLSKYPFKAGSFTEDTKGRWYFNVAVEAPKILISNTTKAVALDLGLKTVATTSDGEKLEAKRFYRSMEKKLAIAQRSNNKKKVKSIHTKIRNRRKDALHKFSSQLVKNYGAIFVGDVSSSKLAKTKLAKSVLDSGWSMLKTQLSYKAKMHSVVYEEVSEKNTTQTCSCCGEKPHSSPKGRAGLGIREWTCSSCGTTHDRDINAARNILALGHQRLAGGIPS